MMKERFMVLFYRKRQGLAWRALEGVLVKWRVRGQLPGDKEGDMVWIIKRVEGSCKPSRVTLSLSLLPLLSLSHSSPLSVPFSLLVILSLLPPSLKLGHHKVGTKALKPGNPPVDASISTLSTNTEPAASSTSIPVETSSHFIQSKGEYDNQTGFEMYGTREQPSESDANISSSLKLLASAYSSSSGESSEEGEIFKGTN